MAECILLKSGGGEGSDDCTAIKEQVLTGYTAITKDSDDEAALGTMADNKNWTGRIGVNGKMAIPKGYHNGAGYVDQAITNRGAVSAVLGINGTYTIPEGYHNGAGAVKQSIPTLGGQTINPSSAQQIVSSNGKYMTGNVTVNAVSNLNPSNIKKGVVVGGVTGTWEGYVAAPNDLYKYGAIGAYGIGVRNGTFESGCISGVSGYIHTKSAINWSGYSRAMLIFSSSSTTSTFLMNLYRDSGEGYVGQPVTSIKTPITSGVVNTINFYFSNCYFTDNMYITFSSGSQTIYQLSVY